MTNYTTRDPRPVNRDPVRVNMKCHYCGKQAVKINIIETRGGAGVTRARTPTCAAHAGLNLGDTCNVNVIRFNEKGQDRFKVTEGVWKKQSR